MPHLSPMQLQTLNVAVDTRQWAQTQKEPSDAGRPKDVPAPSREDEQRYNQTSSVPDSRRHETTDEGGQASRHAERLVGNQISFFVGTMRDVARARRGLAPLREHPDTSPLFGSQFRFFARAVKRLRHREVGGEQAHFGT
jgi:hypothetical protein